MVRVSVSKILHQRGRTKVGFWNFPFSISASVSVVYAHMFVLYSDLCLCLEEAVFSLTGQWRISWGSARSRKTG